METMRGRGRRGSARPLVVKQVAKPVAGQGEIVVRGETSGLCHTDIHAAHGDWPVKPSPPFIPGHEGIGVVEELGSGVTEVAVGDRVAMPWLGYACGSCDYCVSGWETLCLQQKNTGYSIDGSFAEYVKAYGRYVVRVPDGVKLVDAANATGVRRYVMVSSIGAHAPEAASGPMRPYLEAKAEADRYLAASGLDFTIVRPGGLTDETGPAGS